MVTCVVSPNKFINRDVSSVYKYALFDVPRNFLGTLNNETLKQFHEDLHSPLCLFQEMGIMVLEELQSVSMIRVAQDARLMGKHVKHKLADSDSFIISPSLEAHCIPTVMGI